MTKAHAEHNEDVCEFLLKNGSYNDWVVTTAFYSAMHFVQNEIFPLTVSGDTFNNFNHYYNKTVRGKKQTSKHAITRKLVDAYLPIIAAQYHWLFTTCMTSRYHDYKVSFNKAKLSRDYLNDIKKAMTK